MECPWSLGEPVAGVLSTSAAGEVDTPRFDCIWKPPVDLQDAAATEVIARADLRVASHAPPTPWAEASSKLVNAKAQSAGLSRPMSFNLSISSGVMA